jgi:hypothetical protein
MSPGISAPFHASRDILERGHRTEIEQRDVAELRRAAAGDPGSFQNPPATDRASSQSLRTSGICVAILVEVDFAAGRNLVEHADDHGR